MMPPTEDGQGQVFLLPMSAKSLASLRGIAENLRNLLKEETPISLSDLCWTAATARTHFSHRIAAVAMNRKQMIESLDAIILEVDSEKVLPIPKKKKNIFVFSGQGTEYMVRNGNQPTRTTTKKNFSLVTGLFIEHVSRFVATKRSVFVND
jgi:acyl transferase domain-containing protein